MKSNVAILPLLSLIITACSFTADNSDSPPDWVYGQSKKYAHSLYLSGQGSGQTQNDAKDRARSDLAKQFEIAIKERSQQSQTFTSAQADGETQQSLDQKISRQLHTYTSHSLKGVEIVDQWQAPGNATYHALGVLSRNKSRHQFEQELQSLDQHSRQRLMQAEAESSLLTRAALIQQAINSQQQRLVVQSYLQVVDPGGRGNPPSLSIAELLRSRDTLLKEIHIQPVATGDMSSELVKILSGATAGAGFAVANASNVDYQLKARTLLDPVLELDGWYWLRGTMQIDLIDTEGNNIGVQRWPLKISSTSIDRTQQRLLTDVDQLLKAELRDVLLGFAMKI